MADSPLVPYLNRGLDIPNMFNVRSKDATLRSTVTDLIGSSKRFQQSLIDHWKCLYVQASDLSDWMVVDDKRIQRGYTVRVLRKRMTAEERHNVDRMIRSGMEELRSGE